MRNAALVLGVIGGLLALVLGVPFGAIFASPIAVPAIIFSEWRGISHWAFFALAGVLVGLMINFLTASIPLSMENILELIIFFAASLAAAMTYWGFAGRMAGQAIHTHGNNSVESV